MSTGDKTLNEHCWLTILSPYCHIRQQKLYYTCEPICIAYYSSQKIVSRSTTWKWWRLCYTFSLPKRVCWGWPFLYIIQLSAVITLFNPVRWLQELRQNSHQMLDPQKTPHTSPYLVSYGLSFVNIFLQRIFLSAFSGMKNVDLQIRFQWNLFYRVQLITNQHWPR